MPHLRRHVRRELGRATPFVGTTSATTLERRTTSEFRAATLFGAPTLQRAAWTAALRPTHAGATSLRRADSGATALSAARLPTK
jgi:hypothetical protein